MTTERVKNITDCSYSRYISVPAEPVFTHNHMTWQATCTTVKHLHFLSDQFRL